jgi:SNF2 family DNA or RNA helicase
MSGPAVTQIKVELTERGDRIGIAPSFTLDDLKQIKLIAGARKPSARQTRWTVNKDLKSARALREILGERMVLGSNLRGWARSARDEERNLRRLHSATDAKLEHLPELMQRVINGEAIPEFNLPKRHPLSRQREARPYQRADIAMMARTNALNLNQVGTGKTLETVGAIFEAQLDSKPGVVIAPRRSLTNVWQTELERYTSYRVFASEDPTERKGHVGFVATSLAIANYEPWSYALCLIADDLRLEKYHTAKDDKAAEYDTLHACKDYKGNWYRYRSIHQKALFEVEWGWVVVDEFQRTGLNSRASLFNVAVGQLKAERFWFLSATPIGGKPRRLWPLLNIAHPKEYKSEWNWIGDWLQVEEEEFWGKGRRRQTKKEVGDIRPEVEEKFYEHHKRHMVRRLKREALPGLPVAIEQLVETPMLPAQKRAYDEFDKNHEVIVDGKRISGAGTLAVYTRLRQLSSAAGGNSGKFEPLFEALDENGIRKIEPEPGARAYIGCTERKMVDDIAARVHAQCGCDVTILTGKTKDSKPIVDRFESDDPRPYVIVMTIQTGGVALNLEAAGSAHLVDETWDPDEETQFFGRGDRGGRVTPLRCYVYRTPDSIQEYVAAVGEGKKINNNTVLDFVDDIERLRRRPKSD